MSHAPRVTLPTEEFSSPEHHAAAAKIQSSYKRNSPRMRERAEKTGSSMAMSRATNPQQTLSTVSLASSGGRSRRSRSSKKKSKKSSRRRRASSSEYTESSSGYSSESSRSSDYSDGSNSSYTSSDSDRRSHRHRHGRSSRRRGRSSSYRRRSRSSKRRSRRSHNSSDSDYSSDNRHRRRHRRRDRHRRNRKPRRPEEGHRRLGKSNEHRKLRASDDASGGGGHSAIKMSIEERRNQAATRIQAAARMWMQGKKWLGLTMEIMFGWRKAGNFIVNDLIDEVVVDGFIPDVLIEIFSHAGGRGDPFETNPEEERVAWDIYSTIVDEVVEDLSRAVVKKEIAAFVNSYLQQKEELNNQFDPVEASANLVLEDCITEYMNDIVKESVAAMVSEYLFLQNYEEFLHAALDPIMKEIVFVAQEDIEIEDYVDEMMEDLLSETCANVATESMEELKDVIHQERTRTQFAIISKATTRLIETMTLRMLSLSLATNGETIIIKDRLQRLLDTMVIRASYSKLRRMDHLNREFKENIILRHFHQELTAQVGIDYLLKQLKEELTKSEARIDIEELSASRNSP